MSDNHLTYPEIIEAILLGELETENLASENNLQLIENLDPRRRAELAYICANLAHFTKYLIKCDHSMKEITTLDESVAVETCIGCNQERTGRNKHADKLFYKPQFEWSEWVFIKRD